VTKEIGMDPRPSVDGVGCEREDPMSSGEAALALAPEPATPARPVTAPELASGSAPAPDTEALFARHGRFVYRILTQLGLAEGERDDGVQDVFLVAHRRLETLRPDVSERSWLYGIARRVANHHRRRGDRAQKHGFRRPPSLEPATPEELVGDLQAAEYVRRFLDSLRPDRREVFILSEIEGFRAPEIAAATDTNLSTVYTRLRAARKAFDRSLKQSKLIHGER